jgi:hypothetical protein
MLLKDEAEETSWNVMGRGGEVFTLLAEGIKVV